MLIAQPLSEFSIGLSGAVPERSSWTEPSLDRAILEFIAFFSSLVLKHGGQLVHGAHPTFTPVILSQAKIHAKRGKQSVTILISELWAELQENQDLYKHYSDVCEIYVVKRVGQGDYTNFETRNRSLSLMRRHLIQKMNTIVAVGGLFHETDNIKPGVLEEIELATIRQVACFLVGGMGGMAGRLAATPAELELRNYLPPDTNRALLTTKDVAACAGILLSHFDRASGASSTKAH